MAVATGIPLSDLKTWSLTDLKTAWEILENAE
jgi:hypothetical protein